MISNDEAPAHSGGHVAAVAEGSPAHRAGLAPGDHLLEAECAPLMDVIEWRWQASDDSVTVLAASPGGSTRSVTLDRKPGEAWGVEFDTPIFDSVRTCANECVFCFMSQLPPGLRRSLYIRDDDYRLSFLQGNYITLTNFTETDVERILRMRLSPLYISLHAVEPGVRGRLVCARGEDRTVDTLDTLLRSDIAAHVQIVLVPGVNDGDVLDRTLEWLYGRPGVLSVGVVPVGYTRFRDGTDRSFQLPDSAKQVLDQLATWQRDAVASRSITWVHAADEFYVNAGVDVPPASSYDGFPQYENGIGMLRAFADELLALEAMPAAAAETQPVSLVTGELFAAPLARLIASLDHEWAQVLAVPNAFFGGNVSVAGLLTGKDIAHAIRADDAGGTYLVPDAVLNEAGLTLDDMTFDALASDAGADVRLVSCDATALARALSESFPPPPEHRGL